MFFLVLFFLIVDALIFSLLVKRIAVKKKWLMLLVVALIIALLQLLEILPRAIANSDFILLLLFSFSLVLFHFLGTLTRSTLVRLKPSIKDHPVLRVFNFLVFYLVYILVFLYQLIFLLYEV